VSESHLRTLLKERIERVESLLEQACARSGRPRSAVTLVAVTKAAPDAVLPLLPELGLRHLGENRPQELWRKAALLEEQVNWHLIGHLQRNKADRTLPLVSLIHSVDSVRLLQAIDESAAKAGRCADLLIEVNTSGEASKQGFRPADVLGLAEPLRVMGHVRILGLMTMAAPADDPQECRPCFALLRRLRDELGALLPGGHPCTELSMGMSGDFEIAVEEGATLVRIGSAIFEGLPASFC
jgi:pyridoxal phosphate enzyme (YggS family)